MRYFAAAMLTMAVAATACAEPMAVGTGEHSALLKINFWEDGPPAYDYEFLVSFDGTATGLGLFDIVEAETTLTTVRQDFGFGIFIDGISYDGHSHVGYGGGEKWWHYWTRDAGETDWTFSFVGVNERVVADGDADGWTYGRSGGPVPEPATLAVLGAGLAGLLARRRTSEA